MAGALKCSAGIALLVLAGSAHPGDGQVTAGAASAAGERFRTTTSSRELQQLPTAGLAFATAPLPTDTAPLGDGVAIFASGFESP